MMCNVVKSRHVLFALIIFLFCSSPKKLFSQNWEQLYKDLLTEHKKLEKKYTDLSETHKITAKDLSKSNEEIRRLRAECDAKGTPIIVANPCNCENLQGEIAFYKDKVNKEQLEKGKMLDMQKKAFDSLESVIMEADVAFIKKDSALTYLQDMCKQEQEMCTQAQDMCAKQKQGHEQQIQQQITQIAQKDGKIEDLKVEVNRKEGILTRKDSIIREVRANLLSEQTAYSNYKDSSNFAFRILKDNHIWEDSMILCGKKTKVGDILFAFPADSLESTYSTKAFEKQKEALSYLSYLLDYYKDREKEGYENTYKIRIIGRDNNGDVKLAQKRANALANFLISYPPFLGRFKEIEFDIQAKENSKKPFEKGVELRVIN